MKEQLHIQQQQFYQLMYEQQQKHILNSPSNKQLAFEIHPTQISTAIKKGTFEISIRVSYIQAP
jgi:hypothetical protein